MEILGMSLEAIGGLSTLVLTVATSILGTKFTKYKKLLTQFMGALEDDTITKDELRKIAKTFRNL